jgi:hypothetical protein
MGTGRGRTTMGHGWLETRFHGMNKTGTEFRFPILKEES